MKISFQNRRTGLSLIDVIIVIAALTFVAALFFVIQPFRVRQQFSRISCVNNLKQVGLSFRIYAGDNNDQYPMNIFTNNQLLVLETNEVNEYFYLLQNELGTPKVLNCPEDKKRKPASNFSILSNVNISYFVGLDAHESFPQSILAGDRNITNGVNPIDGLLNLTSNRPAGFTSGIHTNQGNIALGDGSVQQVSSARLRSEIIANSGFATNRILFP
jgi:prepilin-type processing-associated H-X9-DG protein